MTEGPPLNYTQLLPCRWGWFVGLKSDPFQTGSILTLGEWAPNEVYILQGFLQPGNVVADVGANVGNMMLAFAAAVGPRGRVICFEPQRFPYMCLCANIALNSLMHYVEAHPFAVGESQGTIDVPILDPTQQITNYGGVSLLDEHTTPTEKVALINLDSLNLPALHLMKVDVEGMELPMANRSPTPSGVASRSPSSWKNAARPTQRPPAPASRSSREASHRSRLTRSGPSWASGSSRTRPLRSS